MKKDTNDVALLNDSVTYAVPIPESLMILKLIEEYADPQFHPVQPDGCTADKIIADYVQNIKNSQSSQPITEH